MGLSGVSGPFRGAYCTVQFSTPSLPPGIGVSGGQQINMGSWNAPFDLEVVDIQLWCASISSGVKVNVLAGGASILDNTVNSAAINGVALGQSGNFFGGGNVAITATPSTGLFGTTATGILNTVTPSSPGNLVNRTKAYGAYIVAGASISATISTAAGPSGNVGPTWCTVMFFPRTHPANLRSGTE